MGSAICLPVSLTGFSAFMAPWKMMLISFQRILLMPYSVRLARLLAVEEDLAADDAAVLRQELEQAERGGRLAAAGLAGEAEALAGLEHEARRPALP